MRCSLAQELEEKNLGSLVLNITFSGQKLVSEYPVNIDRAHCGGLQKLETLRIGSNKALLDTVVWLERVDGKTPQNSAAKMPPVQFQIENCQFRPRLEILDPGQEVQIISKDPINYEILFDAKVNRRRTKSLPPNLAKISYTPTQPEIIPIRGELHRWLKAFVIVRHVPWFAQTDPQGQANIQKIPYGKYFIKLWHPLLGNYKAKLEFTINKRKSQLSLEWN